MLLLDILPVEDMGGSGNRFLKLWYRLECLLLGLYGLVPELNAPVASWGRGSVIWGASVRGEVGTVWNGKIVPELSGIECGCRCCRVIPVSPRIVAVGAEGRDGSGVMAHIESLACIVCCKAGIVTS